MVGAVACARVRPHLGECSGSVMSRRTGPSFFYGFWFMYSAEPPNVTAASAAWAFTTIATGQASVLDRLSSHPIEQHDSFSQALADDCHPSLSDQECGD